MTYFHRLLCAGAITVACAAPALAAPTELIFNSYLPAFDKSFQVGIRDFAQKIEAASGGTLSIKIPDASLAPSDEQYGMLLDGVADMAMVGTPYVAQTVKLTQLAQLPGMAPDGVSASVALWQTYQKFFKDVGEYKGIRLLSTHVLPGRDLLGLDAPLDSAAALKGQVLWVPAGPMTDLVEGIGAVPNHAIFPQLFDAVAKNEVDGLFASPGTVNAARVNDYVHYETRVPGGLGSVSIAIAISDAAWARLDDQQQQAILTAAADLPHDVGAALDAMEESGRANIKDLKVSAATAPMMALIQPIADAQIEAWKVAAKKAGLADPDAAIDFYKAALKSEAGKG